MPRQKSKKNPTTKTTKRGSDHILARLKIYVTGHKKLVFVAVLLVLYLLFRQVEMYIQRAEFRRAEALVLDVKQQVESELTPTSAEHIKNCNYASTKWGRGQRGCIVGYVVDHGVIRENEALERAHDIKDKVSKRWSVDTSSSANKLNSQDRRVQLIEQNIRELNLNCSVNYSYEVVELQTNQNVRYGNLLISITCGGPALAEYYPVT